MYVMGPRHHEPLLYMREDNEWPNVVLAMHMDGDPYWANVTLAMPMDGADNGTTFTDLKGHTATAIGNTVTKTINKAFGTSSAYFDGSGDSISIANSGLDFDATGDLTIEYWCNVSTLTNPVHTMFCINGATALNLGIRGEVTLNGTVQFIVPHATNPASPYTILSTAPGTIIPNRWYHIAYVKQGLVLYIFVNGWLTTTTTMTENTAVGVSDRSTYIGSYYTLLTDQYSGFFHGYIDGLRITKGVARYTTNFELPMYQFPQGTSFIDEKNHTVAVNGNTVLSTTKSRSGGYSAYFDGNGDYLSIPYSTDFEFGSNDFTIEFWINNTTFVSPWGTVISKNAATGAGSWRIVVGPSGYLAFGINVSDWALNIPTTGMVTGNWYHIAFCKSGSVATAFINGNVVGISTDAPSIPTSSQAISIGRIEIGSQWYINGYIDDLRITKGVARYISNFNPPVRFSSHTSTDPYFSNVVLGLHCNGAVGSTNIIDVKGKAVTAVGNAQLSATQSKFGPTACYFDGTGDCITTPYTADFDFGAGNFTIEMWIHPTGNNVNTSRFWNSNGDYYHQVDIGYSETGYLTCYMSSTGSSWNIIAAPAIAQLPHNQWYHIAIVRSGGSAFAFVNGAMYTLSTGLGATVLANGTNGATTRSIGGQSGGVNRSFNGYIDDVRVTKGVARYTAAFTPSRTPFPNW